MSLKYPILKSFFHAFAGIKTAISEEPNFKIHMAVAGFATVLAAFLGFSTSEWLLLFITISFVMVVELINTSLENIINLINPQIHPLAKKAKDVMAAAVLFSALTSIVVGTTLFLPKLFTSLNK